MNPDRKTTGKAGALSSRRSRSGPVLFDKPSSSANVSERNADKRDSFTPNRPKTGI